MQAQGSPSKRAGKMNHEESKKGGKGGKGCGGEEPTEHFVSSINLGRER